MKKTAAKTKPTMQDLMTVAIDPSKNIYAKKYGKTTEIFFDWKKIAKAYKKDSAGLELFISEAKNKITSMLYEAIRIRKIIPDLRRKCESQKVFANVIFNDDEIWGEVNVVICTMLIRWEKICRAAVAASGTLAHSNGEGELRMHTENDLIGYFRNSLVNAFADLFVKHNAQKRAANEVSFSSMGSDSDEDERSFEETLASNNSNDVIFNSYKRDMIKFLRAYDKQNSTKIARLFVALINPRNNGAVTLIQRKLKINNKAFNDTKNTLEQILGTEFSDISREVITHMDAKRSPLEELEQGNKFSRQYDNRKKQKMLEKKAKKPCRLNVLYGQRYNKENETWTYYATVLVDRSKTHNIVAYSPENWENIFKKEATIKGKEKMSADMRPKLEKMIHKSLVEAQMILKDNNDKVLGSAYDNESEVA